MFFIRNKDGSTVTIPCYYDLTRYFSSKEDAQEFLNEGSFVEERKFDSFTEEQIINEQKKILLTLN